MAGKLADWLNREKVDRDLKHNRDMAALIGVNEQVYSVLLGGRRPPTAIQLQGMFDNLGISPDSERGRELLMIYWQSRLKHEKSRPSQN